MRLIFSIIFILMAGSGAFSQDFKIEKQESIELGKSIKGIERFSAYEVFSFDFPNWEPDSLHWNPPSNWLINSDGTWFMYAKHLANMRRTGGLFDTGSYRTFLVNITFYEGYNSTTNKCEGNVIHSRDYILAGLDYKQQRWDVSTSGTDQYFADNLSRISCASATRWIR